MEKKSRLVAGEDCRVGQRVPNEGVASRISLPLSKSNEDPVDMCWVRRDGNANSLILT